MSNSQAKPAEVVDDGLSYNPPLDWSKVPAADYNSVTLTDKQKPAEASFAKKFEPGIEVDLFMKMGPWTPLFDPPGLEFPRDINSELEDAADRQKFGSFSSDWMLWNKNELERQGTKNLLMLLFYLNNYAFSSAMAIHNSSYPASSNESPLFSISHLNSPPFPVSHCNSPLFPMSNCNSPLFYGNSPRADHGSSVKITTSLVSAFSLPFECHDCGKLLSKERFLVRHRERHHCSRSTLTDKSRERHDCKSIPTEGAQFNTYRSNSPLVGSFAIGDRAMGGSALPVSERLEKRNWDCPHPTCNRKGKLGFNRLESLLQHSRNIHNQHVPARQKNSRE